MIDSKLMKNTKYKVGDWLFCQFKLQQIKEMSGDEITTVTDGWFSCRAKNDMCFPLETSTARISDIFRDWKSRLEREGNSNMNMPDIHAWMVKKWCDACRSRNDIQKANAAISELDAFAGEILRRCDQLKSVTVEGIHVFKQ